MLFHTQRTNDASKPKEKEQVIFLNVQFNIIYIM